MNIKPHKFKAGDKVKIVKIDDAPATVEYYKSYIGTEARITRYNFTDDEGIYYELDNGKNFKETELEKINPQLQFSFMED